MARGKKRKGLEDIRWILGELEGVAREEPAIFLDRWRDWLGPAYDVLCKTPADDEAGCRLTTSGDGDGVPPTVDDEELREIKSSLTSIFHSLRHAVERNEYRATRDPLTGLFNRTYFDDTIERELKKSERVGELVSFIMLDLDNLKKINDTYGHARGDELLTACARVLSSSLRASDIVCRWGGDEFLVAAYNSNCQENDSLQNRLRSGLDKWNRYNAEGDFRLAISMGCAVWSPGGSALEVIREADRRMYEEKRRHKRSSKRRPPCQDLP